MVLCDAPRSPRRRRLRRRGRRRSCRSRRLLELKRGGWSRGIGGRGSSSSSSGAAAALLLGRWQRELQYASSAFTYRQQRRLVRTRALCRALSVCACVEAAKEGGAQGGEDRRGG
jgi:hypothetical protein